MEPSSARSKQSSLLRRPIPMHEAAHKSRKTSAPVQIQCKARVPRPITSQPPTALAPPPAPVACPALPSHRPVAASMGRSTAAALPAASITFFVSFFVTKQEVPHLPAGHRCRSLHGRRCHAGLQLDRPVTRHCGACVMITTWWMMGRPPRARRQASLTWLARSSGSPQPPEALRGLIRDSPSGDLFFQPLGCASPVERLGRSAGIAV